MRVNVVSDLITTNSAGQTVEAIPVMEAETAFDAYNRPNSLIDAINDLKGHPVRIVYSDVVLNSAGKPVRALRLPVGSVQYRAIANRGIVPNAFRTATATNLEYGEGRMKMKMGPNPASEIRFIFAGFYALNGNGAETLPGNDETIELAVELVSPVAAQRVLFNAQNVGTIANGVAQYMSDPILPSAFGLSQFDGDSTFWLRPGRTVVLNAKHCKHGSSDLTGENTFYSTPGAGASQVVGTGGMVQRTGGATAGMELGPAAIIGRTIGAGSRSFAAIGDSIIDGSNDDHIASDGSAGGGFFNRALWNVNGHTMPSFKITCGGSLVTNFMAGYAKRVTYFPFATDHIIMFGTNDIVSGGKTAAQILSAVEALADACRANGALRVFVCKLIPRVTSTDNLATLANQAPVSGFENGGTRDQFNASLDTSTHFDGVIHFASCEDPTDHTKWPVTGAANYASTDKVHPTNTLHALMAVEMAAEVFGA